MSSILQTTPHEEECRFILGLGASRRYGHVYIRLVADASASDVLTRFILPSDRLRESDLAEVRKGIADWLAAYRTRLTTRQFRIEVFDGTWAGDSGSAHYEAVQRALDRAASRIGLLKDEDARA